MALSYYYAVGSIYNTIAAFYIHCTPFPSSFNDAIINDLVHVHAHDLRIQFSQGDTDLVVQIVKLCSSTTILQDGFIVEAR